MSPRTRSGIPSLITVLFQIVSPLETESEQTERLPN